MFIFTSDGVFLATPLLNGQIGTCCKEHREAVLTKHKVFYCFIYSKVAFICLDKYENIPSSVTNCHLDKEKDAGIFSHTLFYYTDVLLQLV